jgi:hypothetical protein
MQFIVRRKSAQALMMRALPDLDSELGAIECGGVRASQ